MSVPLSSLGQYNSVPESLLRTTFSPEGLSQSQRLDRIQQLSERAAGLLLENWEDNPAYTHQTMHLGALYACIPSLEAVASSAAHSVSIAQRVTENLQDLSLYLTSDHFLDIAHQREEDRQETIGQLSEIAVLGAMWWGVANGYRDERSYILPATYRENQGRDKDDYWLATDLVLRRTGSREKQPIQVKTSDESAITKRKKATYHPALAVVAAGSISSPPTKGPVPLLRAFARNRGIELRKANEKIDEKLEAARQSGISYRQSQKAKTRYRPAFAS